MRVLSLLNLKIVNSGMVVNKSMCTAYKSTSESQAIVLNSFCSLLLKLSLVELVFDEVTLMVKVEDSILYCHARP
jgi:hypothetical protein